MTTRPMTHALPMLCVWLVACAGCQSQMNLATQQEEYTITSTSKEVALGRKIARQVHVELPSVADDAVQQRVRAIGERIVAVCDRKELVYTFEVIEDPEMNAFSLPGGYVFVNRGLIDRAANDDELAAVIAHEVAHVTARHAVKRYESGLGMQLAQLAAVAARQGAAASGLGVGMRAAQLAYARQDELEADRLGVKYMKAAGFDPRGMLSFLKKLHEHTRQRNTAYLPRGVVRPQYALTHPYIPDRLRAVKETLYGVADYIDYLNAPN